MRLKKPWYMRKTNWAIAITVLNNLLPVTAVVPFIGLPMVVVVNVIAGAFGVYAIADRAGKPNEGE